MKANEQKLNAQVNLKQMKTNGSDGKIIEEARADLILSGAC